jgi:hypothetical protein
LQQGGQFVLIKITFFWFIQKSALMYNRTGL